MTDITKSYLEILEAISGNNWKDEKNQTGNAGVAAIVAFLHTGKINITQLKSDLPDFSQTDIRKAVANLKSNNVFFKEENQWKLSTDDMGDEDPLESVVWWSLMAAVAAGFIERAKFERAK